MYVSVRGEGEREGRWKARLSCPQSLAFVFPSPLGGGLMENRFEELKPKALPFSAIVFLFAVSCGDYCVYGDC
jgi:hypothetical protein